MIKQIRRRYSSVNEQFVTGLFISRIKTGRLRKVTVSYDSNGKDALLWPRKHLSNTEYGQCFSSVSNSLSAQYELF